MSTRPTYDNRYTFKIESAYHEAGHAVIAVLHYIRLDYVQIGLTQGGTMVYQHEPGGDIDDYLYLNLAGGVARAIFLGNYSTNIFYVSPSDQAKINLITEAYPKVNLDPYIVDVMHELRDNWPAVQAVAMVLLEKSYLSGGECKHIVMQAIRKDQIQKAREANES